MCLSVYMYVCVYVYLMHAWCALKPELPVRCVGTGITDDYEPPYGC